MKNLKSLGYSSYAVTNCGKVYSLKSNKFLSLQNRGYQQVSLINDKGVSVNTYVHRLVASMFCEGYKESLHVNHIDGDKSNNNAKNLEWVTRSENMLHAYSEGLIKDKNLVPIELVHSACKMLEGGARPMQTANALGVPVDCVKDMIRGKAYKQVCSEYDFSKIPRDQKLTESLVLKICEMLESKLTPRNISTELAVSLRSVQRIKNRSTFHYLSNSFNF